jgi:hypothetical protein
MSEDGLVFESADSKEVRRLVDEYCSTQRHPSLSRFIFHGPFTRDSLWKTDVGNRIGCYVIYGIDCSLRYIGMSGNKIGTRIAKHLSPDVQQSPFWQRRSPAHFIEIIEVFQAWEPYSLEQYFTIKTKPPIDQKLNRKD